MIIAGQKRSLGIKIISLVLAFTFSFYNVSYASIKTNLKAPEVTSDSSVLIPAKVGIAIDTGTIKSQYQGDSGRTIVHIQDAHCNFEAQNNINKILEQLASECGMDMISVEGAEGIVDTAWFRAFPDVEIRKEVATYFMKKGEITGAEFFSINSEYNGTIFGAETREYYIKNLKAFTEVYPYKSAIEKYFADTSVVMDRLKSIVYPANLKNLDSKMQAFDSKEIELSDYASYLEKITEKNKIDISTYPNFKKLTQTLEYEDKIDFDIVDSERSTYIDVLGKRLPKEEMAELVAQSIRFKKGHIKAVDFYSYLRELAKEKKIKMVQEYPNLFYYYIYTKLYDGIDNEELFKEIDAIQRALKEKFFTTDTERTLDRYDEIVNMYVDLVNIELTNDDYDLFKQYSKEVSVEEIFAFINELSGRYNLNYSIGAVPSEISDNLPNMVSFYEIAMKRDKALIDNTLKEMDKEGKDRCVLIAGGFHTRGMKGLLEKKGISYVVVTPKITKDVETPYIKVLTNQRTSIEDMITESAVMPGMGTTSQQDNMASQTARELVSPLYRIGYANMLFDKDDIAKLKSLSARLSYIAGEESATFIARVEDVYQGIVEMYTNLWLAKVKKNLQEEYPETWEATWNSETYQKDLLGVYLEQMWSGIQEVAKYRATPVYRKRDTEVFTKFKPIAIKIFKEQWDRPLEKGSVGASANLILLSAEAEQMKGELLSGQFGPGIRKSIFEMESQVQNERDKAELEKYVRETYAKIHNIELGRSVLTSGTYDNGYSDVIFVSATQEAADSKSEIYGNLLRGLTSVHSVKGHDNGGQILGLFTAFKRLEKEGVDIKGMLERNDPKEKMLLLPDGGKAERFGVLGLSLKGERAIQNTIGTYETAEGNEFSATLLGDAVINALPFGATNDGKYTDIWWVSQTGFGTISHDAIERGDAAVSKFLVPVEQDELQAAKPSQELLSQLFQFGTATINENGSITGFYGNQTSGAAMKDGAGFALNPDKDYVYQDLKRSATAALDFGSLTMNNAMLLALYEYWESKKDSDESGEYVVLERSAEQDVLNKDKWKRDIDPHFLQPLTFLTRAIGSDENMLNNIPEASYLRGYLQDDQIRAAMDKAVKSIRENLPVKIREKIGESGNQELSHVTETIEFFLLNRDNTEIFGNIANTVGSIRLGENIDWTTFRDARSVTNHKFSLLTNFTDEVMIIVPSGEIETTKATVKDRTHSEIALRRGGIEESELCNFSINGENFVLSAEDVMGDTPWEYGEGDGKITIHRSIVRNTTLLPGSRIVKSVVDNSEGRIIAKNSYVQMAKCPVVEAENSMIHKVYDVKPFSVVKKVAAGVYRPQIKDDRYGKGMTILITPWTYDPKEEDDDICRIEDYYENAYVCGDEGIRGMVSTIEEDTAIEKAILHNSAQSIERFRQLALKFVPLKFGTSGLRGLIEVMTDMEMYINTQGFLKSQNVQPGEVVVIGGDRRPSTPDIMTAVGKAVEDYGAIPEFIGYMPSPTVFVEGTRKGQINIMITGSHIPFDRNGIKYGKRSGEVLKSDEAGILAQVADIRGIEYSRQEKESIFNNDGTFKIKPEYDLTAGQAAATESYIKRYVDAFPSNVLEGVKVAFWQHSAVGRDIIHEIFKRLGAEVVIVERSEVFVPIDTEKLTPAMETMLTKIAEEHKPDLIISTDGDSDRPLLADENGTFLTGDKLGALVTILLEPDFVAFPVSTNDSIPDILEARRIKVVQTKIGSPYVVKAMLDKLSEDRTAKVVSWEANGGYLLGSNWTIAEGRAPITKLASRDAVLPLLAAITLARQEGLTVGELIDQKLRHPATGEHRMNSAGVFDKFTELFGVEGDEAFDLMKGTVKSLSPELKDNKVIAVDFANETIERLKGETFETEVLPINNIYKNGDNVEWFRVKQLLESVFGEYGFPEITNINILDGVKIRFANGESSHLRPSSNAPEFRNYAMANTMERAKEIVEVGVTKIIPALARKVFEKTVEEVEEESDVLPAEVMAQIVQDEDYKTLDEVDQAKYIAAVTFLYEKVKAGGIIPFKRYFKLGSDGYKWGLPFEEYVRESYFNGIGANEILNILVNSLSLEQLEAFQKEYRALHPDVRSSQGFDTWLRERIKQGVVAERWFTANTIEIGEVSLPMKVLSYFPQEIFGRQHSSQYGAKSNIVAKHLTSKVPLSLQLHTFSEMIVPMNKGEAWLGLKEDITAEGFLQACKEGKVDEVMNKVTLETGVPMVVPAFMPHAYGEVNVYEVKAVTAAEDMAGTISFFDRLKFIPVLNELGLSSLDMPAEKLLEINPGRAKKDVLTMTSGQFTDTVKWLKEAETRGMLKKLDIKDVIFEPVTIEAESMARFEKMGETDKFMTARYVLEEGGIINEAEILEGRFHTLFVTEGEVEITTYRGNAYVLQSGQKIQMYTSMGGYEIVANKGPAVIYTQIESLPSKTEKTLISEGKKIEGTTTSKHKENIVLAQFPMGNVVAADEIEIIEKGEIRPPAIIAGREHTIIVTEGAVRLLDNTKKVITELYAGSSYDIEPGTEYTIEKNGIEADKKAAVRFDYAKSNVEEDLYAVYDIVNKHMPALVGNKVDLILPAEMFRKGGRGDVGSKEWEERQLNEMLGGKDTIKIHTYNSAAFESIATINVRGDAVGIIGAAGKNLTTDHTMNEPLQEFIANNRVLPISDQDNLAEGGLLLARKIEGAALLQALLNKDDIYSGQSVAEDTRTLMTQLTGKSVEMTALYYMLPFKDVRNILSQMEDKEGDDVFLMSFMQFKQRLVEILSLKPMQPLTQNLQKEIENRMKALWSV